MSSVKNIFLKIRRFDAYPKTLEDFRIKTLGGALVTIISAILMTSLFVSELNDFLSPDISEEIFVDISRGNKLRINVDIIFHKVSCAFLSIDAMDVSGVQQMNVEHSMFKRRLDLNGNPIKEPEKETRLGDPSKELEVLKPTNESGCGSCYGAETTDVKCCNSCEDIREAYRKKGWAFLNPQNYAQCLKEGWTDKLKEQQNEGCRVFGYIDVNRVAGNFHIAPGRSFQQHHVHVHDLQPYSSSEFNLTHTINYVAFGESAMDKQGPLDNLYVVAESGAMMFQYFAKIVPTIYQDVNRHVFDRTQFSVTRHSKITNFLSGEQGMPGFFIVYELSPMMVRYTEKQKSFMHFLTGVCAIIGGVFTVAGLIDAIIYNSSKIIQRKIELGKAH